MGNSFYSRVKRLQQNDTETDMVSEKELREIALKIYLTILARPHFNSYINTANEAWERALAFVEVANDR